LTVLLVVEQSLGVHSSSECVEDGESRYTANRKREYPNQEKKKKNSSSALMDGTKIAAA